MKPYNLKFGLLSLILVLSCSLKANTTEDIVLSRQISKSFKTTLTPQVDLINKYGNIIVHTWKRDSVAFKIKITAYGKTEENAEKLIDRVSFDHSNSGQFLKYETIFDRQSGSFKEFWNSVTDYSKVLINKNNLNIDYEVYLPEKSVVFLENKFGDVFINDLQGRCRINLSQGDLKAQNISGRFTLDLKFGKANIQQLQSAYLDLQIAEVDIVKANELSISSSSSTIRLAECGRLKVNSRNDKYYIRKVKSLSGESTFSQFEINQLRGELLGTGNFSNLSISEFTEEAQLINFSGRSTDIDLWLDKSRGYDVDLNVREDKLQLPLDWKNLESYYTDSKDKFIRKSGKIPGANEASIHIETQGGTLNIIQK